MRKFTSLNKITIYELDGKETKITRPTCEVSEHSNYGNLVRIGIGEKTITVSGDDLIKAIKNCQNAHY